jgi:hypothetical protein
MVDWNIDEISVVRNTLALGRAEDGSLLVRESGSGVVYFLVPIFAATGADWIIFPPVAPSPADAESPPPDAPRMDMPASEPAPN